MGVFHSTFRTLQNVFFLIICAVFVTTDEAMIETGKKFV